MKMIKLEQYLKSILLYIFMIIILVGSFYYLFELEDYGFYEVKRNGFDIVGKIFLRNTQNFFQYVVFAPIMPLFYAMDCISTSWSLAASIHINGLTVTIRNIIPHGIVEIPNFCLYTLVSYNVFRYFYSIKSMKLKQYIREIYRYKIILLICELLIVVAAVLEGIIT